MAIAPPRSIESFKELSSSDKRKALKESFLGGSYAPEAMKSFEEDEAAVLLKHLTSQLTRSVVAESLRPLLSTLGSDLLRQLLTTVLSNAAVPRSTVGSLLGEVYARTEATEKPLIVSGLMQSLDSNDIDSLVALLGGETLAPSSPGRRQSVDPGRGQSVGRRASTREAIRRESVRGARRQSSPHGSFNGSFKGDAGGGRSSPTSYASAASTLDVRRLETLNDELRREVDARKEREVQLISTLDEAQQREADLEAEVARANAAVSEMRNFRDALVSDQRAEIARVKADLHAKVKSAAAMAADKESKFNGRIEGLQRELREAHGVAASAGDAQMSHTVQLRRANANLEAERRARVAESAAAASVCERLRTELAHANAVGGLAARERDEKESALFLELVGEHERHVKTLQELELERVKAAHAIHDLANVLSATEKRPEEEVAEHLKALNEKLKQQQGLLTSSKTQVDAAKSAKSMTSEKAEKAAAELMQRHASQLAELRAATEAADMAAAEATRQARADVAAAVAMAEETIETERHRMVADNAAERDKLEQAKVEMGSHIAQCVREAIESERVRSEGYHVAALAAAEASGALAAAESVAHVEKSKADAVAVAVAATRSAAEARLEETKLMVEKQASTELLRLQSEITLAHASGESVSFELPIAIPGSMGQSRRQSAYGGAPSRCQSAQISQSTRGGGSSPNSFRGRSPPGMRHITIEDPLGDTFDALDEFSTRGGPIETAEVGVQAGRPLMAPSVTMSIRLPGDEEESGPARRKTFEELGEYEDLPLTCMTNLGTIVFGNTVVRLMPITRCRRLAMTLLQSRYIFLRDDERAGVSTHQDFKDWVVDQILLLYGTYPLASKTLAEFATGIRKHARWRRTSIGGRREPEPIMHFFWRASQLGVPADQSVGSEDIDFFCELLGHVADQVGSDLALNMRDTTFWSAAGMAVELVLPLYVLLAALRKGYARTQPELHRHMSDKVQMIARRYQKALRAGGVPEVTGYRRKFLGDSRPDNHEVLPLEVFLTQCMDVHVSVRLAEGERMQQVYASWDVECASSYDTFHDMVRHVSSQLDERKILELYEQSLDPLTHIVSMLRINGLVRRAKLDLRHKDEPGAAGGLAAAKAMEGGPTASPAAATRTAATPSSKRASVVGFVDDIERAHHPLATVKRHSLMRSLFHNQLLEARAIMVADGKAGEEEEEGDEAMEDDPLLIVSDESGEEEDMDESEEGGMHGRRQSAAVSRALSHKSSMSATSPARRTSARPVPRQSLPGGHVAVMPRADEHLVHEEGVGGLTEPAPSALFIQRPSWEPMESPPRAKSPEAASIVGADAASASKRRQSCGAVIRSSA